MNDSETDTERLRHQQVQLQADLRTAYGDGDFASIVEIRRNLDAIKSLIPAAEAKEIRSVLHGIEVRRIEITSEKEELEAELQKRQQAYAEAISAADELRQNFQKVEVKLFGLDSEEQNLLDSRRGNREKLQKLIKTVEVENDERLETI